VPSGAQRQRLGLQVPWEAKSLPSHGLKAKKTRPYTPRTNGKAERFIKTLLEEWAYVMRWYISGSQ
jgi:transposase InsO family protein